MLQEQFGLFFARQSWRFTQFARKVFAHWRLSTRNFWHFVPLSSSHHFVRMYFLTFSLASHPACGSSSRVYLWSGSPLFPLPRTLTCTHVAGEGTLVAVFGWNWSSVWYKPFQNCHLRVTCSLATWAISWIFPVYSTWREPIESMITNIFRFKDKSFCCNFYLAFLDLPF